MSSIFLVKNFILFSFLFFLFYSFFVLALKFLIFALKRIYQAQDPSPRQEPADGSSCPVPCDARSQQALSPQRLSVSCSLLFPSFSFYVQDYVAFVVEAYCYKIPFFPAFGLYYRLWQCYLVLL